jgi:hypothetical protein
VAILTPIETTFSLRYNNWVMKNFYLIFLCFYLSLRASEALAELDFEDHAFPELVTSGRALAMGNAYINKADDSWAAFYNPAGLGTVRGEYFHLLNSHLEISNSLMNVVSNGPAYQIPGNFIKSFDMQELRTELATEQGKIAHSRFNFFPNLTVRGLTLGYMFSQRNRGIINETILNDFEVAERRDQGPVMALNGSLFGGVFKIGITAVYLTRRELYKSFDPGTSVSTLNSGDYKNGKGLQLTTGAKLTLPVTLLPTFSVVLRNSSANGWENISGAGAPDTIKQTIDLAFSVSPQIGRRSRIHFEANLRDATNKYGSDVLRRLAAGAEFDVNRRIFVRTGYSDGWGSAGIGLKSRTFSLDMTTYAVDRSLDGFREEEDRRWVFSISSGI